MSLWLLLRLGFDALPVPRCSARRGVSVKDVGVRRMKADRVRLRRYISKALATTLLAIFVAGCGHNPSTVDSAWDIRWTSSSEYMITANDLPLQVWSRLRKFTALAHFGAFGKKEPVTDQHLKVFAQLNFPRLRQISLAYCHNVTDAGIQSLTNLPSIQGFRLAGVGLTDRGMQILATGFPNLKGINVEQCAALTESGFSRLTNSPSITSVNMSLDPFSQQQVEKIITSVSNVTWWTISDPLQRLDHESLQRLGDSNRITIQVVDENNLVRGITRYHR